MGTKCFAVPEKTSLLVRSVLLCTDPFQPKQFMKRFVDSTTERTAREVLASSEEHLSPLLGL